MYYIHWDRSQPRLWVIKMYHTLTEIYLYLRVYVTGFRKTDPNRTFGISIITNLKYLTHCESVLLGCSRAIFAV